MEREDKNLSLVEYLEREAFKRGLSMSGLSKEMNLSSTYLHQLKKLSKQPTSRTYYKMAQYLNEDPLELRELSLN